MRIFATDTHLWQMANIAACHLQRSRPGIVEKAVVDDGRDSGDDRYTMSVAQAGCELPLQIAPEARGFTLFAQRTQGFGMN
jgi:hypothetical protein